MMGNNEKSSGLSFPEALQVVFIVLKFCKIIDWSWVWVLAPTWIGLLIAVVIYVVIVMRNR